MWEAETWRPQGPRAAASGVWGRVPPAASGARRWAASSARGSSSTAAASAGPSAPRDSSSNGPPWSTTWASCALVRVFLCTFYLLYALPYSHAAGPACSFSIIYVTRAYIYIKVPARDALWRFAQLRSFLRIVVFLFLKSRASVRACSLKWGNYFKSKLQQCNSCSLSNFLYWEVNSNCALESLVKMVISDQIFLCVRLYCENPDIKIGIYQKALRCKVYKCQSNQEH